jgi:hypothetical protein
MNEFYGRKIGSGRPEHKEKLSKAWRRKLKNMGQLKTSWPSNPVTGYNPTVQAGKFESNRRKF